MSHSGVAWHHPVDVHYGRAGTVRAIRADVLSAAYTPTPERLVNKHANRVRYRRAWINKPPD